MTNFIRVRDVHISVVANISLYLHPQVRYITRNDEQCKLLDTAILTNKMDYDKMIFEVINKINKIDIPAYMNNIDIYVWFNKKNMSAYSLSLLLEEASKMLNEIFRNFDVNVIANGSRELKFRINNPTKYDKEHLMFVLYAIFYTIRTSSLSGMIKPSIIQELNKKTGNYYEVNKNKICTTKNYTTIQEQFNKKLKSIIMTASYIYNKTFPDKYYTLHEDVEKYKNDLDIGQDRFMLLFIERNNQDMSGLYDPLFPFKNGWHDYFKYNEYYMDFTVHMGQFTFLEIMKDTSLKNRFIEDLKILHDETLELHIKNEHNDILKDNQIVKRLIYNMRKNYELCFCI